MRYSLRQLEVFLATAAQENVTRAAEGLAMSQSAASGALKELDPKHGEVKSMRTPAALRGRGAGRALLTHIVAQARARGYQRLSLETGSMAAFAPARRLYAEFGFTECPAFADYVSDPYSVFMTRQISTS